MVLFAQYCVLVIFYGIYRGIIKYCDNRYHLTGLINMNSERPFFGEFRHWFPMLSVVPTIIFATNIREFAFPGTIFVNFFVSYFLSYVKIILMHCSFKTAS
jgi:hypothetical protein